MIKANEVNKWLMEVEHPAKGDKNLVELGMVENVEIEEGKVTVTLGFCQAPRPSCRIPDRQRKGIDHQKCPCRHPC